MKKILIIVTLLPVLFFGQRLSTSPYSSFGYGEPKFNNSISINSMGGIGTAYSNPFGTEVNFSNPATNTYLQYTSFEFGVNADIVKFNTTESSDKNSATYISNLSLGFPLGDRFSFAFGFQPFSGTGYKLNTSSSQVIAGTNETITTKSNFEGSGGLNSAHVALSYKPWKKTDLSFGITGQYIFGNLDNSQIVRIENVDLVSEDLRSDNIKGFTGTAGALYRHKLSKNKLLNIGATYTLGSNLKNDQDHYLLSYVEYSNGTPNSTTMDTISSSSIKQDFKLPSKSSVSVSYEKQGRWMVGTQYDFEKMTDLNSSEYRDNLTYKDKHRIALGGYWIPKFNSYKSYLARATYRAGIYYEQTGLSVLGNSGDYHDIDNLGITFGIGLPVGKDQRSMLNIGVALGQRGTTSGGWVKENYANFKISFNLNGTWFRKRIYN
ncbi:MAG: OmpP1/FadL family transporter [Flavobacteriales bacterium]